MIESRSPYIMPFLAFCYVGLAGPHPGKKRLCGSSHFEWWRPMAKDTLLIGKAHLIARVSFSQSWHVPFLTHRSDMHTRGRFCIDYVRMEGTVDISNGLIGWWALMRFPGYYNTESFPMFWPCTHCLSEVMDRILTSGRDQGNCIWNP